MTRAERTVCDPNCHANPKCGLNATIRNGRITEIGPADYPIDGFENRICLLGRSRLEQQYHPGRLTKPLKRVGERGAGEWEAISWEEAARIFVAEQKRVAAAYGERAVSFQQISGAYGLLTRNSPVRYASLTGGTVIRPSGIDFGIAKGLEAMFGIPATTYFAPGGHSHDDAINSELTIIWGGNPAVTKRVDQVALRHARKAGTTLICIDPVRSETAKMSDEWISLRPGSDGALAWALVHQLLSTDRFDHDFVSAHTNLPFLVDCETGAVLRRGAEPLVWCGSANAAVLVSDAVDPVLRVDRAIDGRPARSVFSQVEQLAAEFPAPTAAQLTGVPAAVIESLATRYIGADPAAIRIGYGVDRWYSADLSARAIAMLACLGGYIGIPGGGVSLEGGNRSLPVKTAHFALPDRIRPDVLSMMQADSAVIDGTPYPVKMTCVSLGNPFNQVKPHRNKVLTEHIAGLEFICVIDHFMTDTAKWADLVLPACSIFEKDDVIVDRFIQLQQRIVEPAGDAKPDFEIFRLLAEEYGIGEHFAKSPDEYIDEMLDDNSALLTDVTMERLRREKVVFPWPTNEPYVGFRDRVFPTPSGRVEFFTEHLREHGAELPYFREPVEASPHNPLFKRFPLVLLSSHSRHRIHSTFANLEMTKKSEPEPVVRISPADARARELSDGEIVEVFNDRGRVTIRCVIDETIRAGCVLIREGHWIDDFIEGDAYGLTHDHHSPTTETYAHYDVLVELRTTPEATG